MQMVVVEYEFGRLNDSEMNSVLVAPSFYSQYEPSDSLMGDLGPIGHLIVRLSRSAMAMIQD
ncbi:hypothetical protein Bca52824_051755 [Brassica carinata]|uniref:Uncharacterized protein n=1 Tax=Brassica carinata TaxID=52824 RepID=A0A8X7R1U7_BRACI|nr:hypothetical protein Bca52824_051755 [Brassica carinata]